MQEFIAAIRRLLCRHEWHVSDPVTMDVRRDDGTLDGQVTFAWRTCWLCDAEDVVPIARYEGTRR